jgi:hypothetical protein
MSHSSSRGISLLEVLFSMLLVTVGLFGAIALLPVAAQQAKRGRNADMQSVAGESWVSEFFVRDMNRTANWFAMSNPPTPSPYTTTPTNTNHFFTAAPTSGGSSQAFVPAFGYCIDPLFVHLVTYGAGTNQGHSRYFPYYLRDASTNTLAAAAVRMERITLRNNFSSGAMTLQEAMSVFASDDDLFFDRVKDATIPASQIYGQLDDGMGNKTNMRRLSENQITWFATLAPRNIVKTDRAPEDYLLSVVLLYKRALTAATGTTVDTDFTVGGQDVAAPERLVDVIDFPGSGIGGGEVTLQFRPNRGVGDLEVRAGDWIMLSGSIDRPVDNPSATPPYFSPDPPMNYGAISINGANYAWTDPGPGMPVPNDRRPLYQWYRVVDADADITGTSSNQRVATLAGPDWPIANTSGTSSTQATLMTGVVAVYEKSVRLNFK